MKLQSIGSGAESSSFKDKGKTKVQILVHTTHLLQSKQFMMASVILNR